MAKTKNITRKNRKQRGGNKTNGQGPSYKEFMNRIGKRIEEDNNMEASKTDEEILEERRQAEEARKAAAEAEAEGNSWVSSLSKFRNPFSGLFDSSPQATGGNKKQPNPAFGGYLKGGKKHVRNTKKNTKKRTGGNKCNCGCKNCRCSRKDCKCKCADKRFKCTCSSRTCGCKRTLKHRKH